MKVQYVDFTIVAGLFYESDVKRVDSNDPNQVEFPNRAFAFRFCSRTEVESDGEMLTGDWEREDVRYYMKGSKVFTLEEVKAGVLEGDNRVLISNMEGNGWDKVVQTPFGNVQPFEENDRILN